jgi:two-component system sensor histidine kinase KdpD
MTDERPTPEQMLERVRAEEGTSASAPRRGRLKLFFGYAAGVGKTYAMLQAAQAIRREGKQVVIGYVEPHERPETLALVVGLEQLPVLSVPYRGAVLSELDLDAALERKPEVILVDELAHTNAPGLRHAKRWQDVAELLDAGIDVYSTVNVQHIESLNDVVAQISGVTVRETVPDRVLEMADEVVLVDLPPEELLQRLRQGKVYVASQAANAMERFFRRENLVALRELALRQTAERVHEDVETARRGTAAGVPWPTNERLLVCVGPSPTSAKVIRAAKRLADRIGAPWIAVNFESTTSAMNAGDQELTHRHLVLADRLGAEIAKITGDDFVPALIAYADSRNVTKLVIGKTGPTRSRWSLRRRSLVDRLVESSGNIDVLIVRGVDAPSPPPILPARTSGGWRRWLGAAGALAVATVAAIAIDALSFGEANLVMLYLLAVVYVGVRYGTGPAVAASISAVLLFDFLFIAPFFEFTVNDTQYLITFAVLLIVGLLTSTLTARVRRQAEVARENERRTEALYRLTRRLAGLSDRRALVADAERVIAEVFDAFAMVYLPDEHGRILPVAGDPKLFAASAAEFAAAQWVYDHREPAGRGTDTLPSMPALYLPLTTPHGVVGVLAVQPADPERVRSFSDRHLLETFASHVGLAVERSLLARQAQDARVEAETEKLRSSLLSAVSHDIRTPLAGIAGAASSLSESGAALDPATRQELLETITDESARLSQLVENLLHMTRLSSGTVTIDRQWHPLEDVIGSTLGRMDRQLAGRPVQIHLREGLPLGNFDAVLIEQLLFNLLDNAVKYSPPDAPIDITAGDTPGGVEIEIADRGAGFASGDEAKVFEMFYRGAAAKPDRRGTGIGLAICRAIVEAHQGTIVATNRPGGGASIKVVLPHAGKPPEVSTSNLERATS